MSYRPNVSVQFTDMSLRTASEHSDQSALGHRVGKSVLTGCVQVQLISNPFGMKYHYEDDKSPELYYLAKTYVSGNKLPRGKCTRKYGS